MAIHDDPPRSAGDGHAGGTGSNVVPAPDPARSGAGAGLRGVLHRAGTAYGGFGDGASRGQSPTVGKDETIKGDIYLVGERVRVEGTVNGDVIAAGKD